MKHLQDRFLRFRTEILCIALAIQLALMTNLSIRAIYVPGKQDNFFLFASSFFLAASILGLIKSFWARATLLLFINLSMFATTIFQSYFGRGLTYFDLMMASPRESKVAIESGLQFALSGTGALFALMLCSALGLCYLLRDGTPFSKKAVAVALFAYLAMSTYELKRSTRIDRSLLYYDTKNMTTRIGIYPVIVGQFLYSPKLVPGIPVTTEPLPVAIEAIPHRKHLVIIQVESLDNEVINYAPEGEEITPFLNTMIGRSIYLSMEPHHKSGSSDADFVMLTNRKPQIPIAQYRIKHQDYSDALPKFATAFDYTSRAWHGYIGSFFERRKAYEEMAFQSLHFKEDFPRESYGVDTWGVPDGTILKTVAEAINNPDQNQSSKRSLDFIVTMDTHHPFKHRFYYENKFPVNGYPDRYFNAIYNFDRQLKQFVSELKEPTTIIIYGDHSSCMAYRTQKGCLGWSDWKNGNYERVPPIVYDTSADLSGFQLSEKTINIYDFAKFVRDYISADPPVVTAH